MRLFHVTPAHFIALEALPQTLPDEGFIWLGYGRREFEVGLPELQARLPGWGCDALLDFHMRDLLSTQLPSHFEDTSGYDLMVFRRLAASPGGREATTDDSSGTLASVRQALQSIDTSPVGFVVYDRVLITVHPTDCQVREWFAQRLVQQAVEADTRGSVRLPASPADLMLRMVNHMVDSYLELRRLLTRQMATVQHELLKANSYFSDWEVLLAMREALRLLEDTCEDQRSAVQEWIDALAEWPPEAAPNAARERELLHVRSRDVLEHIERVLTHVRRLEQSAEAGVQMHFSLLSQRTNNVMRTLTVLTAIFLPLNLITGIFGMNFDGMPLIHSARGFFVAAGLMALVAVGLGAFFWRKRYLGTQPR